MNEPQPLTDENGEMIVCELAIYDVDVEDFVQCEQEATHSGGPAEAYNIEEWVQAKDGDDFDVFQTNPRTVYLCNEHKLFVQEKLNNRARSI